MSQIQEFRSSKDDFFANHPQSPLTADQKQDFQGLEYFDENPDLLLDVEIDIFPEQKEVVIQTSTGHTQTYTRYGKFKFSIDGQDAELTIYVNQHGYFMPFVDSLAGVETYPAGRYLEPEPLQGGMFLVDFNLAYNPFCAYNDHFSCPFPPAENRVKVPIRAGEKIFHEEENQVVHTGNG